MKFNYYLPFINQKNLLSIKKNNFSINLDKTANKKNMNFDKLINLSKLNKSRTSSVASVSNTSVLSQQFLIYILDYYKYLPKINNIQSNEILLILKNFLFLSKVFQNPYKIKEKFLDFDSYSKKFNLESNFKYTLNLEANLSKFFHSNFSLIPFQNSSEWQDAGFFADEIVYLLERRISFRQIKNKLLKHLSLNPHIQGIRITCSGRVGGKSKKAQRAKVDSIKFGQTSLHIFSSQIDFAARTASTPLGSTGVKVWICYK